MAKKKKNTTHKKKDAFASVAFWQLLAFFLLLCFVWVSEMMDLPKRIFDADPTPFNLFRVCFLSAAIITAGIVAVGHTYEQQKSVIAQLLTTCTLCHRIQNEEGEWEHVEEYFLEHFPIALGKHACPQCQEMLDAVERRKKGNTAAASSDDSGKGSEKAS